MFGAMGGGIAGPDFLSPCVATLYYAMKPEFQNWGKSMQNTMQNRNKAYMRRPDAKLVGYLERLPKLGDLVADSASPDYCGGESGDQWAIGQGYKPFDKNNTASMGRYASKHVGRLSDLPVSMRLRLVQSLYGLKPAESSMVDNCGFEAGFNGARVLVPREIGTLQDRFRAAYCDEPLTFRNSFMAITAPKNQEGYNRAKVLAAMLNSSVAVYYAFHGTSLFGSEHSRLRNLMTEMNEFRGEALSGSERYGIEQADLLRFPFPSPADLPVRNDAIQAERELVEIVDSARIMPIHDLDLVMHDGENGILKKIDQLVYRYFCLSSSEIALVEDTVEAILPALRSRDGALEKLWRTPDKSQREQYAQTMVSRLSFFFKDGLDASLVARNDDMAVIRLRLGGSDNYSEDEAGNIGDVMKQVLEHVPGHLDPDFILEPDFRVFVDNYLYLIKPVQARFWLRSTALSDADEIALDLQEEISFGQSAAPAQQQVPDSGAMVEPG